MSCWIQEPGSVGLRDPRLRRRQHSATFDRGSEETGVEFKLIHQAGQGPSVARNHLARVARGNFLFFVDADTIPHSAMLECARNIVAKNPHIDVFYGSYDDEPDHRTWFRHIRICCTTTHIMQSADGGERSPRSGADAASSGANCISSSEACRSSIDRPSIEDIELGSPAQRQGIRIRIFPQLQVKHLKKWTLKNWLHTDLFLRGIPWVRLMRATKDWASQLNFSWSQRAACFRSSDARGLHTLYGKSRVRFHGHPGVRCIPGR